MYSLTIGAQRWLLGGLLSLNQCSVSIHPCAAKPVSLSAPPTSTEHSCRCGPAVYMLPQGRCDSYLTPSIFSWLCTLCRCTSYARTYSHGRPALAAIPQQTNPRNLSQKGAVGSLLPEVPGRTAMSHGWDLCMKDHACQCA